MTNLHEDIETTAKIVSGSVLIALLAWESFSPCFRFFQGRGKHRAKHGVINILLGAGNALMIGLLFLTLWQEASDWATAKQIGILHWVEMPSWLGCLVAILLFDLWTYWWHRWNHEIPFLWRFHRVHHSDPEMDVTTANRFHIGEILISSLLRIPLILLIGAEIWHLALFELIMFPIVQFHHANIRLSGPADRAFRVLFASPAMHKVHHSDILRETNSNYTSMLSVWDRFFGSFRFRKDQENIRIGLKEFREEKDQRLSSLMINPVKKVKRTDNRI